MSRVGYMENVPVLCIRLSERGESWSLGVHESNLLRWVSVCYVCGELCGKIRQAHATGSSLVLTNTESATTGDGGRCRSLYSVMGCPQSLL